MISADIKIDVIQQQKKRTGICILQLFTYVLAQNLNYNVRQGCIFHLVLAGIPSSLILSVKNKRCRGFLLNRKNLLSKVICR